MFSPSSKRRSAAFGLIEGVKEGAALDVSYPWSESRLEGSFENQKRSTREREREKCLLVGNIFLEIFTI